MRIPGFLAAIALIAAPALARAQVPDTARPAVDTAAAVDSLRPVSIEALQGPAAATTDTAVRPPYDPQRALEAELRAALFEQLTDRWVQAVSRLERVTGSAVGVAPVAAADSPSMTPGFIPADTARTLPVGDTTVRPVGPQDAMYLLAQSYYRLGMREEFRQAAQRVLAGAGAERYATVLRAQLLLDAYRRGDYQRALELSDVLSAAELPAETRGLAALVAGLSAYQLREFERARASFAAAQQAGGPYAQYAAFMDVLATLRADTTQMAPAVDALQALSARATGEFAEQVRLAAAQLAYEAERYDVAASTAGEIPPASGLHAQALLTRAWALYKADRIDAAEAAFAEFAQRYPNLPESEEAVLMSAQALLELGRSDEAADRFAGVLDSANVAVNQLAARATGAMAGAARALVEARAAGLLFLQDPASGKTVALEDAAGTDRAALVAPFVDTIVPALHVEVPEMVSLADVSARLDSLAAVLPESGMLPRRVFYTQAAATLNRPDLARGMNELWATDVAVAVASYRLQQVLDAYRRRMALLEALREQVLAGEQELAPVLAQLQAATDSLRRLDVALDEARVRLRQMLQAQVRTTQMLAAENVRMIDSTRTQMTATMRPEETAVLTLEAQTAAIYGQTAELIGANLEGALDRHPVFALRDSVRAHGELIARLIDETRRAIADAAAAIDAELARLRAGEPERARTMRSLLASAQAAQELAENRLVTLVSAELDARAQEVIADLRRDLEAAEFGTASAAFFQALDAGGTPAAQPGVTGTSDAASADAPRVGSGPQQRQP